LDDPFATSPVVDLLPGSPGGGAPLGVVSRLGADGLLPAEALGRLRPHLVEADDDRALGGSRVEFGDDPLFSANSGSTRSPNQVSCFLQRRPSSARISSMRLRLIARPFCSSR
jgi:hypothetical protein